MPSDYDPQDWQKGDTLEPEQQTALSHQLAEEEQINKDQNTAIAGIQDDFAELLTKALTSYANGTPFPFKVNVLTEEQFDEIEVKDPDTLYVRPGGLDALQAASNLSDLLDAAAARANLGLGTAAVEDVSTLQTVIVAAITDAAPSTLDTLNELAAALGDDPNFAATMTAALAGKVGTGDSRLTDTRTPTDGTVTTAKFTGAALVTSLEGLASSNNDTSIPTVKAAKDYIDTAVAGVGGGGVGNGLLSARPSAATAGAGALYFATNIDTLFRSDGTNWMPIRIAGTAAGNASAPAMGTVPTSGWTAVNMQSGAAFAADLDGMLFTIPAIGAGVNWQYQYRAYPTPPFDLTVYLDVIPVAIADAGWSACGIVISDGTKLLTLGPQYGSAGVGASGAGWNVWGAQFSTLASFSGIDDGAWPINRFGVLPRWYRVTDDSTNIVLQCSKNGIDWNRIGTSPRTSFLTPTRIGLGGTNHNTGSNMLMRVRSWHGVA